MADTLVTLEPSWAAVYVEVCRAAGIAADEAAVTAASAAVFGALDLDPARHIYPSSAEDDARQYRTINGAILRQAGVPPDAVTDDLLTTLHRAFDDPARYRLFLDVIPVLRRLRGAGYRLGIISNWSWNLPELCTGLGIADVFAQIVTSARVGISKPHRGIFAYACAALGVAPHEAMHVGDNIVADVQGAQAAGLRAVHLVRTDDRAAPSTAATIHTLDDLDAAL